MLKPPVFRWSKFMNFFLLYIYPLFGYEMKITCQRFIHDPLHFISEWKHNKCSSIRILHMEIKPSSYYIYFINHLRQKLKVVVWLVICFVASCMCLFANASSYTNKSWLKVYVLVFMTLDNHFYFIFSVHMMRKKTQRERRASNIW